MRDAAFYPPPRRLKSWRAGFGHSRTVLPNLNAIHAKALRVRRDGVDASANDMRPNITAGDSEAGHIDAHNVNTEQPARNGYGRRHG